MKIEQWDIVRSRVIARDSIQEIIDRVTPTRCRAISRKVNEVLRLSL